MYGGLLNTKIKFEMEKIDVINNMSISGKLLLLNHIKENKSDYCDYWTAGKIKWLEYQVKEGIRDLSKFILSLCL